MKQATILFLDGIRDWIDPVVKITETETHIIIDNGIYEYEFEKDKIAGIEENEIRE